MLKAPLFERTISPLQYRFPVDRLIQAFKFNRQLAAGRVLSQLLCDHIIQHEIVRPDTLIPVPLHSLRMITRGFNQSYELAVHLSKALQLPLIADGLRRSRNTAAQSGLSRNQRRNNLHGAFSWRKHDIRGQHIALVDDVLTTGSTVTECTRVLLAAGAKRVDVWVPARAVFKL